MRITQVLISLGFAVLMSLTMSSESKAQDPQFTQFYANPLYLNPAFAGTARCPRLVMAYRNQWPALSGAYVTTSASYDQHVPTISGGLGLIVTNDQAGRGTLRTTSVAGIYSYQKALSRTFSIKAGMEVRYFQKSLDWTKLTFNDQIDDRYGFIYNTAELPRGGQSNNVDFSAGLLGFSDRFYFGGSVHHLTEPNESLVVGNSPLPMRFTAHAGGVIPIDKRRRNSDAKISPNVLYQRQGEFEQINVGLYVSKGPLVGGVWYRFDDSFIALVGIQTDVIRFGYSYDVTISQLTPSSGGSHELTMTIQFDCKRPRTKFRTINCPSF
ncbi:MAG: type IX secretion system membrane protein PorP/SprF [Flavobacteriales bacterium]